MDVDNFKHYNDSYGHPAGDQVLKTLSKIIRGGIRNHDAGCRYGGASLLGRARYYTLSTGVQGVIGLVRYVEGYLYFFRHHI